MEKNLSHRVKVQAKLRRLKQRRSHQGRSEEHETAGVGRAELFSSLKDD